MLYASKGIVNIVRQCFSQSQFKLVAIESLISISSKPANASESEYIDGLLMSDAEFDAISDKQTFIDSIDQTQHLYVITNKSYNITNPKVTFLLNDNTRIKNYFDRIEISPINVSRVKVDISTINVKKEEPKVEQKVETIPIKQEEIKQDIIDNKPEPVQAAKVEREVSLINIQLSDIIRIASSQNDKFKLIKNQLKELGLRLRNTNGIDIQYLLDNYLQQEDSACIELVNEFKKIIEDVYHKYCITVQGKVDEIYTEACAIANKQLYGMDQVEIDKLLQKRNVLLQKAIQELKKICNDFSSIDRVSSELIFMLQKYTFEEDIKKLPFIYDKETMSESRFELYKSLVEFKCSLTNEDELRSRLDAAIALLSETNSLTDRIMQTKLNNTIINIGGLNVDYILNTDHGVFTAVKLSILKFKIFSRIPIHVIDLTGLYKNAVEKFYNGATYVASNNVQESINEITSSKSDANIVIISPVNNATGINLATHVIIPTDVTNYLSAESMYEKVLQVKPETCILVTPCDTDTGMELKGTNKIVVPYNANLTKNKELGEILDDQQLFKIACQIR